MNDDNKSEDAPVFNLSTQRASLPQRQTCANLAAMSQNKLQSPGRREKVLQTLKQASNANSQQRWSKTSGIVAFSTKAIGCRLECDKTIPRSSPYSSVFTIRVSAEK